MLKLPSRSVASFPICQPPSGGCVLKQNIQLGQQGGRIQPPSGGCVLKHGGLYEYSHGCDQPPSGGCVLKQ